jgi:hypothetical protein
MQANRSASINRQRMSRMLVVCFASIGLFTLVISAARGRNSQGASEIKLTVEDPRPVAKAIETLEGEYGWVITYEDPRYVHDSEVADVTLKVRRDLDQFKPGEAPKVFAPAGGLLEFTYDVAPNTNLPPDPARVVRKLLDAQAANSSGGRFRLESGANIMHVIPTSIKNSVGVLVPQGSVLDTIISLPAEERSVYEKIESICAAISRASNIPVELGRIPDNWFRRERDQQGANGQRARDILVNTFEKMDHETNLSWQLFYGPGRKRYSLNIQMVPKRKG